MEPSDQEKLLQAARLITQFLANEQVEQPKPVLQPDRLREKLPLDLEEMGLSWTELLASLETILESVPQTGSRRFWNQLFGGRSIEGIIGELLSAVTNNSMYTYKVGGAWVLMEMELIESLLSLIGFEEGQGMLTPGGSLSNLAGLLLARDSFRSECAQKGSSGRLRVYVSEDGHYSFGKAVRILGIGAESLVSIPTDSEGRMSVSALEEAAASGKGAGGVVVATCGSTVRGAFDPLPELSEVCRRHSLWLHGDGAYGSSALFSERREELLDGASLCDSFTFDAHKVLGIPLTCSFLLCRQKGWLDKSLGADADYLFQSDFAFNPGAHSLQCGRRNDALKFWIAWKSFGSSGFRAKMAHLYSLTEAAKIRIEKEPTLSLVHSPMFLNLCFQVEGVSPKRLCHFLDQTGQLKIGSAVVAGNEVVRLCCVNSSFTEDDVDFFFDTLLKARDELLAVGSH